MSTCYVSTLKGSPQNKQCFETEIDPKQTGHVVLSKVLNHLDIVEEDFFGLKYVGPKPKKEELWLNLRNKLCDQIVGSTQVISLKLRVKFFEKPHKVQQEATKELFYLQAKDALCRGLIALPAEGEEAKLAKLIAFIAQAEHQDQTQNSYQNQIYEDILKEVQPECPDCKGVIEQIHSEHSQLHGMPTASARYFFLQEVSGMQGFGMEYHRAHTEQGADLCFGVGPEGILLKYYKTGEEKQIPYAQIHGAKQDADKAINIQLINDLGELHSEEVFKLVSRKAAIALYRCITEMYSFYRCDTVGHNVQTQHSRDFKGTFISIFNENTELGKRYIFDIQRTSQEAYDLVRRKLFAKAGGSPAGSPLHSANPAQLGNGSEGEEEEGEVTEVTTQTEGSTGKLRDPSAVAHGANKNLLRDVKHLKRRLEEVEDSLLCCICMYRKVSMVLCPCGHMVCDFCSPRIKQCPQCRTEVERFQKVFHVFGVGNANRNCHKRSSSCDLSSMAQQPISTPVL